MPVVCFLLLRCTRLTESGFPSPCLVHALK